jgi:hypothetical protein
MNFIKKIIKKRWHLHIIVGAIFGLMLFGAFSLLGFYDSTRWWEEMAIQLVFGTVFGLAFEIIQDHTSAVYYKKLEIFYKLQIFSRNKIVGSKADAFATGIGFAIVVPLIYIFI